MKGILLISHGVMAEGVRKTAEIFFGSAVRQFDALCLAPEETAEAFREKLQQKVLELDSGEGVIIMADLLGGTPCNQCLFLDLKRACVISGMNLPMVMECLAARESENFDFDTFAEEIKGSIVNFSRVVKEKQAARQKKG